MTDQPQAPAHPQIPAGHLSIEEANAQFALLSDAEKRVAIAGDVIKWVQADRLNLRSTYWRLPEASDARPGADLRELLSDGQPCECCAKGAIFFAHVMRLDQVKTAGLGGYASTCEMRVAMPYFNNGSWDDVEFAFEADNSYGEDWWRAFGVNETGDDRRELLTAICLNIIRNNGDFKIEEAPYTIHSFNKAEEAPQSLKDWVFNSIEDPTEQENARNDDQALEILIGQALEQYGPWIEGFGFEGVGK